MQSGEISRISGPEGSAPHGPGSEPRCDCQTARTSRNSRTLCARPTNSAWLTSAWPIDTSSRCGRRRNTTRLSRSRSWPALTPRPSSCASLAARVYGKRLACLRLAALERARERLGVELDAVGPYIRRPADWRFFAIDEQAHADPSGMEVRDDATQQVARRLGPTIRPDS